MIKKSVFIGYASPANTEEEAKALIEKIKAHHSDAASLAIENAGIIEVYEMERWAYSVLAVYHLLYREGKLFIIDSELLEGVADALPYDVARGAR